MPSEIQSVITAMRQRFHKKLLDNVLYVDPDNIASNADSHSRVSKEIALNLISQMGLKASPREKLKGQTAGAEFETLVAEFIEGVFTECGKVRPGSWTVLRTNTGISYFEQYSHLKEIAELVKLHPALEMALGRDYLIKPDVLIVRHPEEDSFFNQGKPLVDLQHARLTPLRKSNNQLPILHASISCKWTIRSDRAQNSRSEALNLIRNRKGKLPHIVAITAEVLPARLTSLALGTGDIDCIYHIALPELVKAVSETKHEDAEESLTMMIQGKRLRDISDLVLDLVT